MGAAYIYGYDYTIDDKNNTVYTDNNGDIITDWSDYDGYAYSGCDYVAGEDRVCGIFEWGWCSWDGECNGDRKCEDNSCEGTSNC